MSIILPILNGRNRRIIGNVLNIFRFQLLPTGNGFQGNKLKREKRMTRTIGV